MLTFFKKWRARRAFIAAWDAAMADEYKSAMCGKRCMDDMQRKDFRQALLREHGLTEADVA